MTAGYISGKIISLTLANRFLISAGALYIYLQGNLLASSDTRSGQITVKG